MLPNFLIIGAQRCATGWISRCLREHPDIYIARDETRFFDCHYQKGLAWWEQTYFGEYRGEKAVGEKTANYLYGSEIPQRAADSLPGVKLICSLRDPVERLYSNYIMQIRKSKSLQATSLLQAMTPDSDFVRRSLYLQHIRTFLQVFPRESILIKIYEDKFVNPASFLQDIFRFLDVDSVFIPPSTNLQTKAGAFERRHRLLSNIPQVLFSTRSPLFLRRLYTRIRPQRSTPDIDENTWSELSQLFYADIAGLEELLNRDLDCWKSKAWGA